ncbi:phosphate acetyltransferase [Entomospira culicis]|uniref:Phosphate acetyltransferase n=1 Tax=Entomospira culicis TaxID=2719989 RepID=A0A968GFM5_9SPIO|nr:phosphate acetyltransferase [Entomospira culicis]NIZ19203.1 phosphate acetyltransferase [Entomospira culicis]NIZ69417.1 phosphate acetyltransferase [Entomospira culicis]WDI36533.1 phosphate acetyltransferase [Entomospira culicis]WDI38159.1 phosphate acetyltransferase [Entomospira culicis]
MDFVQRQKFLAKKSQKHLVLPEGYEPRTLQAAKILKEEGLASKITLIGDPKEIEAVAFECALSLDGDFFEVIDPNKESDKAEEYAQEYVRLRQHKGKTIEQARLDMKKVLNYGAMMVRLGDGDCMVAGADHTTGDVLRSGFEIIKTAPNVKYASSCFVMDVPDKSMGADGLLIFADCATIPSPNAEQLAEIAIAASESCRNFLRVEPICAMLSFSTYGSASHPDVDKVVEAVRLVKTKRPDLNVDGEMQLDAALASSVAKKKAPNSSVAGKANTLIFPDLQSGNIGYKLVQRFAKAGAYGPFMQGFAKPISDLSRGATVEDIVNTCAVMLAQA